METWAKVGIGVGVVAVVGVGGYVAYRKWGKPATAVATLPPVEKRSLPPVQPIDDRMLQQAPPQPQQQVAPAKQQMPPPLPPAIKGFGVLAEDYVTLIGQPLYWNIDDRKLYNQAGTAHGTDEQNLVRLVRLADGSPVDIEVYVQPNGKPYQPSSAKPVNGSATLPTGPDFMMTAPAPNYGGMKMTPLNKGGVPSTMGVGASAVSWQQLRRMAMRA